MRGLKLNRLSACFNITRLWKKIRMTPNNLATLHRLGIATADQVNDLADVTMRIARTAARVACKQHKMRYADIEDVVQMVTIKALGRIKHWQFEKSAWQTFVSVIARSTIADQGRKYLKDHRLYSAMVKEAVTEKNIEP